MTYFNPCFHRPGIIRIFLSQLMIMNKIYRIPLLFALLLSGPAAMADSSGNGHFIDRTKILSVRSIVQQEDGMIWFGTDRSLYSFDGYDLSPFPCPDGHILINRLVQQAGNLLLGTNDGIYFFNLSERGFRRATPFDGEQVRDLLVHGDFIYVGSDTGLYRYDPAADTAIRLTEGDIFSLAAAGDILYVGTRSGLGTYKTSGGTYTPLPSSGRFFATSILPEGNTLWIGTPSELVHIDIGNGRQLEASPFPIAKSIYRDREGRLMVGTDNGLFRYDPTNGRTGKISDIVTWTCLEDRLGDLWFGTETGLLYLRQTPGLHAVEGLPENESGPYTSMLRDSRGRFWASGSNGIFQLGDDGGIRHYAMSDSPFRIPHNKVRRIVQDPRTDELYFCSDGGILRYDEVSGQMVSMSIPGSHNWVYDLLPLKDELWAATFEGVFRLRKDGTTAARYTQQDGLSSDDVARIIRGRLGRVWVLTRDQHVFRIDPVSGEIAEPESAPEGTDSMCGDAEGRIWIAAANRILRITPQEDGSDIQAVTIHPDNDLESYSLVEAEGRIWVCSSEGLFSVGEQEMDVRSLGTYKNYVSIAYDEERRSLLLGTAGNVDEVSIAYLQDYYDSAVPPISITGVLVNGTHKIEATEITDKPLVFSHKQNHLEISFSDFDYDDQFPHRFDYRLDGRNDLRGTVTGNKISLTALQPGRYRLAVAPSGIAAGPVDILSFRIRQPWYLSPWMILFYLGLLGGVIFTIVKLAITRRYLELERTQRDELAEQSRQKAAFFQDLAHELKTPLSLVIGPLGKVIREAPPGTDLTDLQIAQENAMHLSTLIHHTIDFYKGTGGVADSPMTSDVEFVDFARTIFDSWRDNYPKHEFIFSSSHPAIPVTIDIVKIETVLNNLLSNACKYTPEGGSVLMTLERDDIGHQLIIKVSDTGIGIPDEEIPFAFQRYFESSRTKQGGYDSTGIGLSVIKKYVEVHGGQVAVDSDANGTTFTVLLPCLAEGAGVGSGSAAGTADAADTDKPLIAIVDDNAQICNFLESLLKENYRCVCSHNGKSGLKLCQDVIPDLIISDVRMPVMDGLEMCRQIRKFAPLSTIPIILLTAKDDRETEQQSIDLNIDVFLPKPFEVPTLTARVGQLLGNKKRMEQRIRMEMLTSPGSNRELSQDEKFMKKVTQLIEEHLDDADLSVSRLCDLGDFSEKQLYRKLKQFTGLSAVEYIRSIRLKKAALLLQSGNFTVSEVMYSVGFSNASYFTRTFSAAYNMTPSDYMKSFKK